MAVLYRKYRPQRFADVIGQNHIKVTIGNEIANGTVAHAYLFVGPRGTGKTTLARLVARAINCEQRTPGNFEPCNTCSVCVQILADRYLDVMEIDAATHTQVDNVRDNIISSSRVPALSPNGYKVFIIDEIHMLSKHAFNALLKTIEEPPSRVVFILATTDIYKVPETIISRCQRFDFKKIPQKLIMDRLHDICAKERVTVPDAILASISRKSEGCLRDAESLLGQVIAMAEKGSVSVAAAELVIPKANWQSVENLLEYLHHRNLAAALGFINELVQEGLDCETFIADMIEYIRQVLLKKTIGASFKPDFDDQTVAAIITATGNFTPQELKRLLEIFMREAYRSKTAMIPQLPLELACIEFCHESFSEQRELNAEAAMPASVQESASMPLVMNQELALIKKQWSTMLTSLKDYNHSLSVFLKVAHPLQLVNNKLTIGFKYDFHANTVRESKNKPRAEEALGALLGRPVTIDCIVDSNYTVNHKNFNGATEPEVQDVLTIMGGGEVI